MTSRFLDLLRAKYASAYDVAPIIGASAVVERPGYTISAAFCTAGQAVCLEEIYTHRFTNEKIHTRMLTWVPDFDETTERVVFVTETGRLALKEALELGISPPSNLVVDVPTDPVAELFRAIAQAVVPTDAEANGDKTEFTWEDMVTHIRNHEGSAKNRLACDGAQIVLESEKDMVNSFDHFTVNSSIKWNPRFDAHGIFECEVVHSLDGEKKVVRNFQQAVRWIYQI